jgi:hypothetical protein
MQMNKIIRNSLIFTLTILINYNSFSQDVNELTGAEKTIEYAVPFLTIAPDSRAGAMGDVGVALSPDVNSMHWNPAKYAFIENNMGAAISYTPWLRKLVNDINLAYLSAYKRIDDKQVVSASLIYFSLGEIIFTNDFGDYNGQHTPNEFALDVAYSRKFSENFSGGVAFRYIRSDITGGAYIGGAESKAGNAVAADVSVYYRNNDINISDKEATLSYGLNISNIGSQISYSGTEKDFLPTNLRIGSALKMKLDNYNSLTVTVDINKFLVPTTPIYDKDSLGNLMYDEFGDPIILAGKNSEVSVPQGMLQSFYDAPGGYKEELHEIKYSVGFEYLYLNQFAIRAGYFHENQNKGNRKYFTVGAGIKLNVFNIDFSYLVPVKQNNPLANTVRFTLGFDFEAFRNQQKENN